MLYNDKNTKKKTSKKYLVGLVLKDIKSIEKKKFKRALLEIYQFILRNEFIQTKLHLIITIFVINLFSIKYLQ